VQKAALKSAEQTGSVKLAKLKKWELHTFLEPRNVVTKT
jgi:hypothetical protein